MLLLGVAALSLIRKAFIVKARGGTDEAGESWAPLKAETIAYGRRHPGLRRTGPNPKRPLLTKQQDALWRGIYAGILASTKDPRLAAAIAWTKVKAEGGRTIKAEYGGQQVEILRDRGLLLNSLSPGVDGPSGAAHQVFRIEQGGVIVGTNRKGALAHHNGTKHLPQRRLWPDPTNWPAHWWKFLLSTLRDGVARVLIQRLQRR